MNQILFLASHPFRKGIIENMDIEEVLEKNDLAPDQNKGQNFLTNRNLIRKEVNVANVTSSDTVLEIGPGPGNLTEVLARRSNKVIAVEQDRRFKPLLERIKEEYDNLELIFQDALEVEFPEFDKVIANLPFKIALPLIFKLLNNYQFDSGLLLIQRRLANRITARPGEDKYCRLSVQAARKSKINIWKEIPNKAFYPAPEVDASFIKIKKTEEKFEIPSLDFFKQTLKFLFTKRDEKLRQALGELKQKEDDRPVRQVTQGLKNNLLETKIVEMNPDQFGKVCRVLYKKIDNPIDHFYSYYKDNDLYKNSRDY